QSTRRTEEQMKVTGFRAPLIPILVASTFWLQGCSDRQLKIQKLGDGQGIITSDLPDHSGCDQNCSNNTLTIPSNAQTTVTLNVGQLIGSNVFAGGAGARANLGTAAFPPQQATCVVTLTDAAQTVFASFLSAPPPNVPNTSTPVM